MQKRTDIILIQNSYLHYKCGKYDFAKKTLLGMSVVFFMIFISFIISAWIQIPQKTEGDAAAEFRVI